jgi:hypothetical protein
MGTPRIKNPTTKQTGNNHIRCNAEIRSNKTKTIHNENKRVVDTENGKTIPPLRT